MAAAAALHRLGIHATVYERAPRLEEVGAGMMLWPNATRVLKELGLLDGIAARSGHNPPNWSGFRSAHPNLVM